MSARALLVLALLLGATACDVGEEGGRPTEVIERYTDPRGWRVTFPEQMHVERSVSDESRLYVDEVTIASFELRSPIRTERTRRSFKLWVEAPADEDGRFPDDAVAFRMMVQEGGPRWQALEEPESRFPLRLRDFRLERGYPGMPPGKGLLVVANGRPYWAYTWVGRAASAEARRELAEVVASLRFPSTRTGTTVAGLAVLEEAAAYPLGSFTRVWAHHRPVYLVHAPGGFYGVAWHDSRPDGGYRARCPPSCSTSRLEFVCLSEHARWDRLGRILVAARDPRLHDRLEVTLAKASHDGRILLSAHSRFVHANDAQEYWPLRWWNR